MIINADLDYTTDDAFCRRAWQFGRWLLFRSLLTTAVVIWYGYWTQPKASETPEPLKPRGRQVKDKCTALGCVVRGGTYG